MRMEVVRLRLTFGMVAIAGAAMTAACGSSSSPTTPTPAGPTFSQQIQADILTPACVRCHTDEGRTPAGGLILKAGAAYAQLVNVPSPRSGVIRVIPGNPSGSYLVQKLEGAPSIMGARMPLNSAPLTDAQIALIRQWIQNGAPNN